MKIVALALNTFREAVRNYIVYSVISFAALLVAISAFFGTVTIGDQVKVIKDFGLFSLSFFGAVLTIVCGVSLLNKEIRQKTVFNILSKPVERWQFILGKHLGLSLTVASLVSLMGLGFVLFAALFEHRVDWLLFQGILFTLLEMAVIGAIAIFFSSLVVTTTLTGLFTLGAYLAGRSIGYLQTFLAEEYSPVVQRTAKIFYYILPDLSVFNLANTLVYGERASALYLGYALLYGFSYSAVCLILASWIFSRRELT